MSMDDKTKEMIALGAAVTANCHRCLDYHLDLALKAGLTAEEIEAAIAIGKTIRRGAYSSTDAYIQKLLQGEPSKTLPCRTECSC